MGWFGKEGSRASFRRPSHPPLALAEGWFMALLGDVFEGPPTPPPARAEGWVMSTGQTRLVHEGWFGMAGL